VNPLVDTHAVLRWPADDAGSVATGAQPGYLRSPLVMPAGASG